MDIETENRIAELEEKLKRVSDEWTLARDNLLWACLIGPSRLRFGLNNLGFSPEGMQAVATDSGDALAAIPTGTRFQWFRDSFTGTKTGEIGGGYSTPSTYTFHNMVMRAMANADGANVKIGVWDESTGDWSMGLSVQDSPAVGDLVTIFKTSTGQTVTTAYAIFTFSGTTDGYLSLLRSGVQKQVMVAGDASILTDTAWAAAGDLVVGSANDTAVILGHPGTTGYVLTSNSTTAYWENPANLASNFDHGKAITTSQGQNLP